jgi:ATP-dependent DNA helicase RecG
MSQVVEPRQDNDVVTVSLSQSLAAPLHSLRGVGERTAEQLSRLGLHQVRDLLFHLPLRYQDRSHVTPLGALRGGNEALVEGEILLTEVRFSRRRILLVKVGDGTGILTVRFFHFNERQREGFIRGQWLQLYGEVRRSGVAEPEMIHPEYQRIAGKGGALLAPTLTPIYPGGDGVRQPLLRKLINQALALVKLPAEDGIEWLDENERAELGMMSLDAALLTLHEPSPNESLLLLGEERHPAQRRLAFEELLVQQLSLRQVYQRMREHRSPRCQGDGVLRRALLNSLPFALTAAQQRVCAEIAVDLDTEMPMQRLVQGDVGSGKTVVAAL